VPPEKGRCILCRTSEDQPAPGEDANVATATSPGHKKTSRWSSVATQVRERLKRSKRIFMLSLIVACGIEVMVDWNATLREINVLRDRVRERGVSYVHILAGAADEPMTRKDTAALAHLSEGLFSDDDVIFVRFVDTHEQSLFEQLEPKYAAAFQQHRQQAFVEYFAKQIDRDLKGVMFDFDGQRERMVKSRYRDFPQRWNDATDVIMAHFVTPPAPRETSGRVLYQQALRTPAHEREAGVTYAFGTVPRPDGLAGAVVVAFSMDRTNDAIFSKYLKGLGMVLFFVALILMQNLSSRREKLQLLNLETRYKQAKQALRDALVETTEAAGLTASGALEQSSGSVDGQLYVLHSGPGGLSALLVDPDGEGIEAAALALQVRQCFLKRRADGPLTDLVAEVAALGDVATQIPLSRPLGLLLVHVFPSGAVSGVVGPVGGARLLRSGAVAAVGPLQTVETPKGLVGPISRFAGTLAAGETLLLASAGLADDERRTTLDLEALAGFVVRSMGGQPLRADAMADAASWARGRSSALAAHDITLVAISRSA